MHRLALLLTILASPLVFTAIASADSFDTVIASPDPQAKYFFYLHDELMEEQGINTTSKRYGPYLYERIITHFKDRGLTVINEIRTETNPNQYAATITTQVRRLLATGIPAGNITVGGFSKGGYIALLVASSLGNPDVGYAIMAGCGRGRKNSAFDLFLRRNRGSRLKGRIYSIYAGSDLEAGSCRPAIEQSSGEGLRFRETRLKSGKGHGLFYQPRPEWLEPVAIFAKGGR